MQLIQNLNLADMADRVERASAIAEGRWLADRAAATGDADIDADQGPAPLGEALAALFQVLSRIDTDWLAGKRNVSDQEMTELGEQGQQLLDDLQRWHQQLKINEGSAALGDLSVPLAEWLIAHGAKIKQLETVVNQLADLANSTRDPRPLSELDEVMTRIIEGIDGDAQRDIDNGNPQRPWRVLLLNHAIVATRTLVPERMIAAFDRLVQYLPDDAPGFFTQGMGQLDTIGYPPPVRDIIERYYLMWNTSTLH